MTTTSEHHRIVDGQYVCSAPAGSPCRVYPGCECESWTAELHGHPAGAVIGMERGHLLYAKETIPPAPGHEPVPQDECWTVPWIRASDLGDSYSGSADEPDYGGCDGSWFPDGPVKTDFDGDCLWWSYADATRPQSPEED